MSKVQIRWLIRRDLPEVLEIERRSFEFAWDIEDLLRCIRQRNCIGMVAERDHRIVGFMVYTHPDHRREGIGSTMVRRLVDRLSQQRRKEIVLEVRESNLGAQLFFRSQGFRAFCVSREFYTDTDEAAYLLRYRLPEDGDPWVLPVRWQGKNRISEYEQA